jgi:hypothetical protein
VLLFSLVVVSSFLLIFRDAFFGIRDDRLLRDGVYDSILLDLGFVYFRGNVGLLGIQSLWNLLVEQIIPKMECGFVALRLCTLPGEVDSIVMQRFVVSNISDCFGEVYLW